MEYHGYYKNIKTSRIYAVIGICKIKRSEDWLDGVIYVSNGKMYCRTKKEFDRKFARSVRYPFKLLDPDN